MFRICINMLIVKIIIFIQFKSLRHLKCLRLKQVEFIDDNYVNLFFIYKYITLF